MLGEDMWNMGIYAIVFIMFLLPWLREGRQREGEERVGSLFPLNRERPYPC